MPNPAEGVVGFRDALSVAGWSQFSFLRQADHPLCANADIKEGDRVVVITHSCDLLNDGPDEPRAECVIASPIDELPPQAATLGNPRLFAFAAYDKTTGAERAFQVRAASRFEISKSELAKLEPDNNLSLHLPGEVQGISYAKELFSRWLARRYNRSALPDELLRRAKPSGQMKACYKRMFEKGMRDLRAVVIPHDELAPDDPTPYQVLLYAYLKEGASDGQATEVQKELKQLAKLIHCPLVQVTHVSAKPIEDVNVPEFSKSHPFDFLAY